MFTYKTHTNPTSARLPEDLITAIKNIYEPAKMRVTTTPIREIESVEYGASRLSIDGHVIAFRIAKITPTKIGQFVTIWKRPKLGGDIAPLDNNDGVDFVVVSVFDGTHRGQFVFDQDVLVAKGIMSRNGQGGKRAIRVYPPWSKPVAKAAIRTQNWQLPYFFSISHEGIADLNQVRKHFKIGTGSL
jgi:hypothetical protein